MFTYNSFPCFNNFWSKEGRGSDDAIKIDFHWDSEKLIIVTVVFPKVNANILQIILQRSN